VQCICLRLNEQCLMPRPEPTPIGTGKASEQADGSAFRPEHRVKALIDVIRGLAHDPKCNRILASGLLED
jgi:hypothetical protein